jgi:putative ABC transport system permease protein
MLALRLALRELRGGFKGFRVFLACLALGVAAIAGVGSLADTVTAGLAAQGRSLLGGDVEVRLALREANDEERAYLESGGAVSEIVVMHSLARAAKSNTPAFIHLKAIDDAYPLFGTVELDPPMSLDEALADLGAIAEATLLDRLGLEVGDTVSVGEASFEIRAVVVHEPDRVSGGVDLGPHLIIARPALDDTELVREGSLIRYSYRIALGPGIDRAAWVEGLQADLPSAGWRVRDAGNPQPTLKRYIDRLAIFLTLVGLSTLLIGGLGVAGAVRAYLEGRRETIATLKCLGASGGLVFRVYLLEMLVLAGLGTAIGLIVGGLAPFAAAGLVEGQLPGVVSAGLHAVPLLRAAAFGLLTALCFTLWPLARARDTPAASLFRDIVAPAARAWRVRDLAAVLAVVVALAVLVVASVAIKSVALWFIAGALVSLFSLQALADGLRWAARRSPRPRQPLLRLALGNLHRPGAPTGNTILALGLGLSLVVAVGQVENNIVRQIEGRMGGAAPAFYFIDIQPDQIAPLEAAVAGFGAEAKLQRVPHLRGRITAIKGVPVEAATVDPSAAWAVNSDRGITYAAAVPTGSTVVAGEWWPEDYAGPPLISLGDHIAHGLGVTVGDTLTINILGRDIVGRIASLRAIDWSTLGINFVIVFAPGTLEAAPQSHIATVHVAPADEGALFRAVTERLPNVSGVGVSNVLESIKRLLGDISTGARAAGLVTLLASALVVGGAVAAGQRRRIYDAVVLKVLGATRGHLMGAFVAEFAVLGVLSGLAAAALGSFGAWLIITRLMRVDWVFAPGAAAGGVALCLAVSLGLGFAGTWRALGRGAAPVLRHD